MKKVFLGPLDLGLNQVFKQAMEQEGYKVTTCSFVEHGKFGWENDIELKINKVSLPKAVSLVFANFFKSLNYDIYHFKFGQSLLPWNLDLLLLWLLGKKIVMNWHGSDIRQLDRYKKDKWNREMVKKVGYNPFKECYKRCRYGWISLFAHFQAVSTPDLLEFAPKAIYMPEMAPASRLSGTSLPSTVNRQPKNAVDGSRSAIVVLHAPSHRGLKGTEYIIEAVENLKNDGVNIELLLAENVPADKMGEYYQKADLVIDQLLIGSYGVVSIEAMLAAKPVICYIREDLARKYPESLPIINANPDNLSEVLSDLIKNNKNLEKIAQNSYEYATEYHSSQKLAQKWAKIYQEI